MDTGERRQGPTAAKRRAILDAALSVFAQHGYARASIELIAAQADVSTRTIYNHFHNKSELFQTVIEQSAARVAVAQIAIVEQHLGGPCEPHDLEGLLVTFATAWTRPLPDYAEHRALVEQIRAEVGRIPPSALDAWQRAGPLRVRRALARALAALADHGLLRTADPDGAALHFTRLVTIADPFRPGRQPSRKQAATIIASGVHTFLYGYSARSD